MTTDDAIPSDDDLPAFDNPKVQLIFEILCDDTPPPNPEHRVWTSAPGQGRGSGKAHRLTLNLGAPPTLSPQHCHGQSRHANCTPGMFVFFSDKLPVSRSTPL